MLLSTIIATATQGWGLIHFIKYKYKYKYLLHLYTKTNTTIFYHIQIQIQIQNKNINTLHIKSYFKSYDHKLYKIIIIIPIPDYILIN